MKNDPRWDKFKSSLATENKPGDSIAAMALPLDVEKLREQYPDSQKQNTVLSANEHTRPEVSADAKYIAGRIVKHLWMLLFVMPIVALILFAIVEASK